MGRKFYIGDRGPKASALLAYGVIRHCQGGLRSPPAGTRGGAPVVGDLGDKVPQKPVIFYKLQYPRRTLEER
jgi:hypothetical protein